MSVQVFLRKHWQEALSGLPMQPSIWFCHRGGDGQFVAYGGLQAAREALMDLRRNSQSPAPTLVFGFQEEQQVRSKSREQWPGSECLLDWLGAAYLRYDASVETLRAAGLRVAAGCVRPLPEGLLQDSNGLLRLSGEIRHWLGNRQITVKSTLDDFRASASKRTGLSPYYLNPVPAMSDEHQRMVRRLEAYQGATGLSSAAAAKLSGACSAVRGFVAFWGALETAKAGLRGGQRVQVRAPSEDTLASIEDVLRALDNCIEATLALDAALQEEGERGV